METVGDGGTLKRKRCSICNEVLVCGGNQAGESCWCAHYPPIMPIDLENDCLCEDCLSSAIQKLQKTQIWKNPKEIPHN